MTKVGCFRLIRSDYRTAALPRGIRAVYADPPYHGNEILYNCDRVELSDLIPRMEEIAPIRAMSMSQAMLPEAQRLRPDARVAIWRKPSARLGGRPHHSWEPVLLWGNLMKRDHPNATYVPDSLNLHPAADDRIPFWSPKPDGFCDWILEMMIGSQTDKTIVDVFSGSGSMSRRAMVRGCDAIGIDTLEAPGAWTGDWQRPTLKFQAWDLQDKLLICSRAANGYPEWPIWWDNRHQWVTVYHRTRPPGSTGSVRKKIPGIHACSECHYIRVPAGQRVPSCLQSETPDRVPDSSRVPVMEESGDEIQIRRRFDGTRSWIRIDPILE